MQPRLLGELLGGRRPPVRHRAVEPEPVTEVHHERHDLALFVLPYVQRVERDLFSALLSIGRHTRLG
jgi:hypothetical protein